MRVALVGLTDYSLYVSLPFFTCIQYVFLPEFKPLISELEAIAAQGQNDPLSNAILTVKLLDIPERHFDKNQIQSQAG